jgi:hypothetical protein
MSEYYALEDDGFILKITISPIDFLKLHEEVIGHLLARVVSSMRRYKSQLDPVIIDGKTGIVLDGMHRVIAARELGLDKMMTCEVDYLHPDVKVKRWIRGVRGGSALLEDLKVRLRLTKVGSVDEAIMMVDEGKAPASLLTPRHPLVSTISYTGLSSIFSLIKSFDKLISLCSFHYEGFREEEIPSLLGMDYFLLYVPTPSKEDVLKNGLSGKLFPPKYTRHIIPARPVGIAFPLEFLKPEKSLKEARGRLIALLSGKDKKVLPPNSLYMGRVYEEKLYVFH